MSTLTKNFNLVKPERTDAADITSTNANWDTIDGMLSTALGAAPMVSIDTNQDESYVKYCGKIDAILANMPSNTTKLVSATPPYSEAPDFGACAAILYKGNDAYASLIPVGHSNIYTYGWRMQKKNGNWEEFEWDNPPMSSEKIYCTTERFNGKKVYAVCVNKEFASKGFVSLNLSGGHGETANYLTPISISGFYRVGDEAAVYNYMMVDNDTLTIRRDEMSLVIKNNLEQATRFNIVIKFIE